MCASAKPANFRYKLFALRLVLSLPGSRRRDRSKWISTGGIRPRSRYIVELYSPYNLELMVTVPMAVLQDHARPLIPNSITFWQDLRLRSLALSLSLPLSLPERYLSRDWNDLSRSPFRFSRKEEKRGADQSRVGSYRDQSSEFPAFGCDCEQVEAAAGTG